MIYRPYFQLRNGQSRYGLEHESESDAWQEIGKTLDVNDPDCPEWSMEPFFILGYGVDFLERKKVMP